MLNTDRHKCMDKTNTTILMQSFAFVALRELALQTRPIEEENKKPYQMTLLQRGRETRKKEREGDRLSKIDDQKEWQWGPKKR